jgi:micrococcal nuclease
MNATKKKKLTRKYLVRVNLKTTQRRNEMKVKLSILILILSTLILAACSKPQSNQNESGLSIETGPGIGIEMSPFIEEDMPHLSSVDEEEKFPYYDVVRVVDGDTIIINFNGKEERVRMIGIDTPETVHPTKPVEPFGPEASEYTKRRLEGKKAGVELDVQERDQYGRLLAYVWVDGVMINNELLEEGLAVVSTYPPNVKYVELFRQTEKKAKEEKKNIWGS